MKLTILAAVSAAALLAAGGAYADSSTATVTQTGSGQQSNVDQTGSSAGAVAVVNQDGANNIGNVTESGSGNSANVDQSQSQSVATANGAHSSAAGASSGTNNDAEINQKGKNGHVQALQAGNNTANVTQDANSGVGAGSLGETAEVFQFGSNSGSGAGATIYQNGSGEEGVVYQDGKANNASIIQTGTGDGLAGGSTDPNSPVFGVKEGNLRLRERTPAQIIYGYDGAIATQLGNNNSAGIAQSGLRNFADVSQDSTFYGGAAGNSGSVTQGAALDHSDGIIYQQGVSQTATVDQDAGSSYSATWQNGASNHADVFQRGTAASNIEQGQATGSPGVYDLPSPGAPVTGAVASVNQNGATLQSTIMQYDGSSAYVTQIGSVNTSAVTQNLGSAGSYASVLQTGSNGNSDVTQNGTTGHAEVTQSGDTDTSHVIQSGASEYAALTQSGSHDLSTITQAGTSNQAFVNQASTSAISMVSQNGTGNYANVHQ